jgi:hypothetical protein
MLAIVGTVPIRDFPLTQGPLSVSGSWLEIRGNRVDVNRGTPALMAAAAAASQTLGGEAPYGFLVGDIGHGKGSRELYHHLTEHAADHSFSVMTFHYLQPIAHWNEKVITAVLSLPSPPRLIADAGFMYAAKMSGHAQRFDLFTPDMGELAFLADENAPHPFYTRGFILHEANRAPELIARAYAHGNAARYLLVKGAQDYMADKSGVLKVVSEPSVPALEAIGGTGDTVTGIVSALVEAGYAIPEAAAVAAAANRLAGRYAQPTPATQVMDIVRQIPRALGEILSPGLSEGTHASLPC